jgi:hypothetical protein
MCKLAYRLSLAAIATGFSLFAADLAAAARLGHKKSPLPRVQT